MVLCLLPALGRAQAVIHQAALDQLAGLVPAPPPVAAPPLVPVIHHVVRHVVRRHVVAPSAVVFDVPPPLPGAAPPPAAATPAVVRPGPAPATPAAAMARPVPAAARPSPSPHAVALRFAAGSAVLPAGMAASLKPVCAAAEPSGIVNIDAPAPGAPGDPSVAMRLSMQRAFAVRDALVACGISPSRIVPRATGASGGGDLDTARVTLGGAGP